MKFSDQQKDQMAAEIIMLVVDFDRFEGIHNPTIIAMRNRVACSMNNMFCLMEAAGVMTDVFNIVKSLDKSLYIRFCYMKGILSNMNDKRLELEMQGEVGDINQATKNIIDKLSKMDN